MVGLFCYVTINYLRLTKTYRYSFVVEYSKHGIAKSIPLIQMQAIIMSEQVFDMRGRIGRTMA